MAMSCTSTYLSLQFFHLSIRIFFTHVVLISKDLTNKFESIDIKFHKEFMCRNREIGAFRYAGVQDKVLKLYPVGEIHKLLFTHRVLEVSVTFPCLNPYSR